MRSFVVFLLLRPNCIARAQTTSRGIKCNCQPGYEFVYYGQVKNNKPDGKGLAVSKESKFKIFADFKNGLVDGNAVAIFENGEIEIEQWVKGREMGNSIWLSEANTLNWGQAKDDEFEGKLSKIKDDLEMQDIE